MQSWLTIPKEIALGAVTNDACCPFCRRLWHSAAYRRMGDNCATACSLATKHSMFCESGQLWVYLPSASTGGFSMNTVRTGNRFEAHVLELLREELEAGGLALDPKCSSILPKPKYFSRDRRSDIIFDISIEVRMPGATQYSFLFLIECKDYTSPVPVNDIEEFFMKVQQVGAANSKAASARWRWPSRSRRKPRRWDQGTGESGKSSTSFRASRLSASSASRVAT